MIQKHDWHHGSGTIVIEFYVVFANYLNMNSHPISVLDFRYIMFNYIIQEVRAYIHMMIQNHVTPKFCIFRAGVVHVHMHPAIKVQGQFDQQ